MFRTTLAAFSSVALLSACAGGGGAPLGPEEPPVEVPDDAAFETYTTSHNGYDRARRDLSTPADAAIIRQFEDSNPASPAGYRNLIELNRALYADRMTIEVLAQVDGTGSGETVQRLLRLTADQQPLEYSRTGSQGTYFLRGANYAWVTIDDGPVLSGSDSRGLVDLVLDFDNGQADINLRTTVAGASVVRSELVAEDLPFNIVTGEFGGPVTVAIHDPDSPLIFEIGGSLRGNVGGTPTYANGRHDLSASGLYTATGTDQGSDVTIEGAFAGIDPNALPPG
ncbi:hypothetical protein [Wenxinia marina]|uniref:Viral aspartic protease n=1 Tax=Wenxinia marina DSM 24838 TaxID=1123501 RepID=A0A0D0NLF8_9RHOB|nr:hypothetical protein [Wenxinia marina]KIQ69130.1 hypothetical protein Wenmar_02199 [Wenxinia marina DSM 24838]GGL70541.1 hypothetical protein GCM10011392_26400 [Wenxinia marina]